MAGLAYSNFYEWKDGKKQKHPVIDYQAGSVRDDFDFGSLLMFNTIQFKAASYTCFEIGDTFNYAGLYMVRLFLSINARIIHIDEYLYTETEKGLCESGEKQFPNGLRVDGLLRGVHDLDGLPRLRGLGGSLLLGSGLRLGGLLFGRFVDRRRLLGQIGRAHV